MRRLSSWKEIAVYLDVSVRTAQRWEREEGLPAQRHHHGRGATVSADADAVDRWLATRRSKAPSRRAPALTPAGVSLAVLPFANLTGDSGRDYIADGLTEEVIHALTSVPGIGVTARTSAFQYKGRSIDIREIAAELGVGQILEGSVRATDDRLRVTVQMIDAAGGGAHLWSEALETRLDDLFRLQARVAEWVVNSVRDHLPDPKAEARAKAYTEDLEVYRLFAEATAEFHERSYQSIPAAVEKLRGVVAAEPRHGPAWAMLAEAYVVLYIFGAIDRDSFEAGSLEANRRALEIDEELAEAHLNVAAQRSYLNWDWAGALEAATEGLRLNPGSAAGWHRYAQSCLAPVGRLDEALAAGRRAVELDPLCLPYQGTLAWGLFTVRRYSEVVELSSKLRRQNPHNPEPQVVYGLAHLWLNDKEKALEGVTEARKMSGDAVLPLAAHAFVAGGFGDRDEASSLLVQLQTALERAPANHFALVLANIGAGDLEAAAKAFEAAADCRESHVTVATMPVFDAIRDHARFRETVDRMGVAGLSQNSVYEPAAARSERFGAGPEEGITSRGQQRRRRVQRH